MTISTTACEKRRQRAETVARRKADGLCIDCEATAGVNQDGTRSVRCDDCRAMQTPKHRRTATAAIVLRDFDAWESPDRRDTHEFKEYVAKIERLFDGGRIVTTRLIHETYGHAMQSLTLDALGFIDGIVEVGVHPVKWQKAARRVKTYKSDKWNGQIERRA